MTTTRSPKARPIEPLGQSDLDSQRWGPGGGSDDAPISIPADRWDWVVAGWPHARWLAWHRRVTELTPWGSGVEQIRDAGYLAYLELVAALAAGMPQGRSGADVTGGS